MISRRVRPISLRGDHAGEWQQPVVGPVVTRFRRRTCKGPQPNPLVIDAEELGHSPDNCVRIRAEPHGTVQQVLSRVIRGIADERLRIDDEPRLPLRAKDVARVEVRHQQNVRRRALRQFLEQAQTLIDKPSVGPSFALN